MPILTSLLPPAISRSARRLLVAVAFAAAPASLALSSTAALAQDGGTASVDQIVTGIEGAYKDVSSLRADFVQVTRSPAMGEGEKQRGKVQLMRPRMMRWDFTQPDPKLFVTDGKTMWVYTPADKQVFVSKDLGGAEGGNDGGMDSLLTNLENLDEYFVVTVVDREGGAEKRSYVLDLAPKGEMQFKRLRLELSRKDYSLEKLVIVDAFDTETELSFSNLKTNPGLEVDLFTFEVPSGVQVVSADGL